MRGPHRPDPEWQARAHQIRAAARKGKGASEIADACQLPVAVVKRVLAPTEHPRLSDPVDLIRTGRVGTGKAPADVQLYWYGFLTAAGQIMGQGTSLTLVVTLGEENPDSIAALPADLVPGHMRCEFCRSSIVGWQGYLRDQALCKALVPWGIPSDLYGDDPGVLNDLPKELIPPFLRGYVDGDRVSRGSPHTRRNGNFTLRGTPAVLAALNAIIQRYWKVASGVVTQSNGRAELRFASATASRAIHHGLNTVASRWAAESPGTVV
jgi:hypothetical protein